MNIFSANSAYLALLSGIFFAIIAFITPGTGILEIITLALFSITGYGIIQYGVNAWALLILLFSFMPLFYALQKPGRYLALGIATLGMTASALFLFPGNEALSSVSLWVAIPGTLIFIMLVWFIALEIVGTPVLPDEIPSQHLSGLIGEAKSDIYMEGSVQVGGQLWSARSHTPIEAGQRVRVIETEGLILTVEPIENDSN